MVKGGRGGLIRGGSINGSIVVVTCNKILYSIISGSYTVHRGIGYFSNGTTDNGPNLTW